MPQIEIRLLIAHEGEVEGTVLCLVAGVGAGDSKSASECGGIAGIAASGGIGDRAVAAAPALHHEVTVPGVLLGQSYGETDAEFFWRAR